MSFTSFGFYMALLPAVVVFYYAPTRWRAKYLLALSYAFYAYFSALYAALLAVSSVVAWWTALRIARSKDDDGKGRWFLFGLLFSAVPLLAFKTLSATSGWIAPLGISYYTFKLISYLIDVYWDEEAFERDPILVMLYAAFFPQIVSGPIQRSEAFFSQMREMSTNSADGAKIEEGFKYVLSGLMLKLIFADRLAEVIASVDAEPSAFTAATLYCVVAGFTLQLFADFAGYTLIALGIGKLFGVDGPPNFSSPFAATNIVDMWKRWHMSLTSWLTDYLLTPLMMTFRAYGDMGFIAAIFIDMVAIGLWHGFSVNFLAFGLLQACFITISIFTSRQLSKWRRAGGAEKISRLIGVVVTFAMMSISQIFFHAPTWAHSTSMLAQVFGLSPSGAKTFADIAPSTNATFFVCGLSVLYIGAGAPGMIKLKAQLDELAPSWLQLGFNLFLLTVLAADLGGKFVYGQF